MLLVLKSFPKARQLADKTVTRFFPGRSGGGELDGSLASTGAVVVDVDVVL